MALLRLWETLAVGCGSAELTALRALRAATWAGLACCGAGTLSQKPRALMMSAGDSGAAAACCLGSDFSAAGAAWAGFAFGAGTIWASADASCRVAAAGLAGF